ncbi:MAG: class I SAM-dependent methyltransferase [Candidatus Acetothermia bacterium]
MKQGEGMGNIGFQLMTWTYNIADFFRPGDFTEKLENFGISKGDVVIDYGCGPGRYLKKAAELVGEDGLVYAADTQPLALKKVRSQIVKQQLQNVEPVLIHRYDSGLADNCADLIYALDMFHQVDHPDKFFAELKRVAKRDGVMFLEDGHQSREMTVKSVKGSGHWKIDSIERSFLKLSPAQLA